MSMSDCEKCWSTPCECGWGYRNWSVKRRTDLANILLNPPFPPEKKPQQKAVVLVKKEKTFKAEPPIGDADFVDIDRHKLCRVGHCLHAHRSYCESPKNAHFRKQS